MRRWVFFVWLLPLFLAGCRVCKPIESQTEYPVVIEVQIVHHLGEAKEQRQYKTAENISMVLNYLRLIKLEGVPQEDPMSQGGGLYHIILIRSDGSQVEYVQKADRYLWRPTGGWQMINKDQAPQLGQLFRALPSDQSIMGTIPG